VEVDLVSPSIEDIEVLEYRSTVLLLVLRTGRVSTLAADAKTSSAAVEGCILGCDAMSYGLFCWTRLWGRLGL
jgi:hypothetical protein